MTDRQQETQRAAAPLPEFNNPPINEVVCGVQFKGLDKWLTPHFGLFWERVKGEYPEFQDQNPLGVLSDLTDSGKSRVESLQMFPLRRVWLLDESQQYLIQVDPPRFLHNWRKLEDSDPYPRFQAAYTRFTQSLELLRRFADDFSMAASFHQYELSYINHILGDPGDPISPYKYFSCFKWDAESKLVGKPEGLQMSFRVRLRGKQGVLIVSAKHGKRRSDDRHVLILELTARGSAEPAGTDMQEWYRLAHETIVRSFVELTTSEAHKVWGRTA